MNKLTILQQIKYLSYYFQYHGKRNNWPSCLCRIDSKWKQQKYVIKTISYFIYIFYYRFTLTTHRFINRYMGTRLRVTMERRDVVKYLTILNRSPNRYHLKSINILMYRRTCTIQSGRMLIFVRLLWLRPWRVVNYYVQSHLYGYYIWMNLWHIRFH